MANEKLNVQHFFDDETNTLTYVVWDSVTQDAIVIDPVLNYNLATFETCDTSVQKIHKFIREKKLKLLAILETHAHADHLTGAQNLKALYPSAVIGIGKNITIVQQTFFTAFGLSEEKLAEDFDVLLSEDCQTSFGSLTVRTIFTPGHTPACSSYKIRDCVFVGDTLFMPDFGTGRCDFPGGNAETLYHSIKNKLYALPEDTRLFVGHDYPPPTRALAFETTLQQEKQFNIHVNEKTKKEDFINFRTERDKTLDEPRLLIPSLRVNIVAGKLSDKIELERVSKLKL